jgi:hypothetical protein
MMIAGISLSLYYILYVFSPSAQISLLFFMTFRYFIYSAYFSFGSLYVIM